MSDEPRVSDRSQYVIGTLISIALLTGYLLLSGEQEEKSAVAETRLQDVSIEKQELKELKEPKEPKEIKQTEEK